MTYSRRASALGVFNSTKLCSPPGREIWPLLPNSQTWWSCLQSPCRDLLAHADFHTALLKWRMVCSVLAQSTHIFLINVHIWKDMFTECPWYLWELKCSLEEFQLLWVFFQNPVSESLLQSIPPPPRERDIIVKYNPSTVPTPNNCKNTFQDPQ